MHEGFDIEDAWRVKPEILFEVFSSRWQILIHENLDKKPEVLVSVEADPCQAIIEHESRGHCFFREVLRVNAVKLEATKIESTLLKLNDRYFSFAFCLNIPIKIKLPCGHWLW